IDVKMVVRMWTSPVLLSRTIAALFSDPTATEGRCEARRGATVAAECVIIEAPSGNPAGVQAKRGSNNGKNISRPTGRRCRGDGGGAGDAGAYATAATAAVRDHEGRGHRRRLHLPQRRRAVGVHRHAGRRHRY